jgi:hypothetical protein
MMPAYKSNAAASEMSTAGNTPEVFKETQWKQYIPVLHM